jgi:hypothetical protein
MYVPNQTMYAHVCTHSPVFDTTTSGLPPQQVTFAAHHAAPMFTLTVEIILFAIKGNTMMLVVKFHHHS